MKKIYSSAMAKTCRNILLVIVVAGMSTLSSTASAFLPEVVPITAEGSGKMGRSPMTGDTEEISIVHSDTYITASGFDGVYYVDEDMSRHPFADYQTYFTWNSGSYNLYLVSGATLGTLRMGVTMSPKPGVVLVKIQSLPEVYAVTSNPMNEFKPILRWVDSEDVASSLYGENWADYIIDIQPSQFSSFSIGPDISSAYDIVVDKRVMIRRDELGVTDETDSDNDGITDREEMAYGTNVHEPDSDNDGLGDWEEVNMYSTNPLNFDSDNDLLGDAMEVNGILTDPKVADTDSDGLIDGDEVNIGTDPLDFDTDNDGIYDREEIYVYGTNPNNRDSDGDGYSDGMEVASGYDPLSS